MRFSEHIYAVKKAGRIPIIADFKRISPKEGDLFQGRSPVAAAQLFEMLGAPAISVVTEPEHFGGSMELLKELVSAVNLPVLRKDFIRSAEEVKKTADAGASAVLLICSYMTEAELTTCYEAALDAGIEPLVETHTIEELRLAARLNARLVGINNRDIAALEKDDGTVRATGKLAAYAPTGSLLISESGISAPEDAKAAVMAGADAVLVGTALWKAQDMGRCYCDLCGTTEVCTK